MDSLSRDNFTDAFILHRRPYRESSLLVDFLTRDAGLVAVVARSGRRRGVTQLEPFRPLVIRWSGRGELKTLVQVEPRGALPPLLQTIIWSGLYANELLLRLCARFDPHPPLFEAYAVLIRELGRVRELTHDAAAVREQWLLRVFEKTVLETLGYGLLLTREARTGAPVCADQWYEYNLDQGPLPVAVESAAGSCGIRVRGRTLLALAAEQFDTIESLVEAKQVLRAAIDTHLGSVVLRSRQLRREVEAVHRQVVSVRATSSNVES